MTEEQARAIGEWIVEKVQSIPELDKDALEQDAELEMCRWAKEAVLWFGVFLGEVEKQILPLIGELLNKQNHEGIG